MKLVLVLLLAISGFAAPTQAAEDGSWAAQLSRETMSPFCPGRALSDCPSPQAETLNLWIRVQEAAGRSRADVEEELYERYGDVVLGAPRASGIGLAAYVIPAAGFLGGGLLVVVFLRRQTRRGADPAPPTRDAPRDPELERLVDEEFARQGP